VRLPLILVNIDEDVSFEEDGVNENNLRDAEK